MSQLSAQSIRALCLRKRPMITPFSDLKAVVNGRSWGLSAASYDIRIAEEVTLGPDPGKVLAMMMQAEPNPSLALCQFSEWASYPPPPSVAITHSIEDFIMPRDVVGYVMDKSTYARLHVSAFNTLFDPGFEGNATLELVNLGYDTIHIAAGDPICQITFHWLDRPTDRTYAGKYQFQPKRPVAAINE